MAIVLDEPQTGLRLTAAFIPCKHWPHGSGFQARRSHQPGEALARGRRFPTGVPAQPARHRAGVASAYPTPFHDVDSDQRAAFRAGTCGDVVTSEQVENLGVIWSENPKL